LTTLRQETRPVNATNTQDYPMWIRVRVLMPTGILTTITMHRTALVIIMLSTVAAATRTF
jgi:hypothetical protein